MNLSSLSNGLRVVTILLLSQNYSIMAINCTLCEDGSYPTDDTARVNFEEGTLDCERLHYLAKTVTNETVCAGLHVTGNVICGCGVEPPSPCTLCSDGTDLPDPGMTVLPGRSCQELQAQADAGFNDDCKWWQALVGPLCDCPADDSFEVELRCNICPGELLPMPNKTLQLRDGTNTTCLDLELEANTNSNADCSAYQMNYAKPCNCFGTNQLPQTSTPISAAHSKWVLSRLFIAHNILLYLATMFHN